MIFGIRNLSKILFLILPLAATAQQKSSCEDYAMDVRSELTLWARKASTVQAGDSLPVKQKARLTLKNGYELPVAPEKTFTDKKDAFAGTLSFVAPEDGTYRVSAGAKVWIDVVEAANKTRLNSPSFEMQTGCDKIFKVVTYELKAGTKYVLQISSSKKPNVDVLITRQE